MKRIRTFLALGLCIVSGVLWAADRPYTEGSVWNVTLVRVKPGMDNAYLSDLATGWKNVMEEARKQGLVVSYKILVGSSANRDDWNLMLLTESKNWASFDGADAKFDAIAEKMVGPEKKQMEMMIKRSDIREIVGNKNLQELHFK